MALVMENTSPSLQQQSQQSSFAWTKRERRAGRHDAPTFDEPLNARPEVVSGPLLMLASGSRQAWPVFVRLYKTSAGRMLVLWPDKLHASPIGCVTLKDVAIISDDQSLTLTLRSQYDALPLALRAATCDDYRRWSAVLSGTSDRKHRKFTSNVVRLPMLIEEEP